MQKKLQLQILDPTGEVAVTHHFYYNAGRENKLRLTICDNTYIMNNEGKLVIFVIEYNPEMRNKTLIPSSVTNCPHASGVFQLVKGLLMLYYEHFN